MSAYEMYDLKSGRWKGSLFKFQQQRPQRQYTHEPPPFDLRRFSAPRLHPKTRAAVMGVYLCGTFGRNVHRPKLVAISRTGTHQFEAGLLYALIAKPQLRAENI